MSNDTFFWQRFSKHTKQPAQTFQNADFDESDPQASRRHYYLGAPYTGQYLTRREAECLLLMLRGYTNGETAEYLKLSSRTIEYYLKNIRNKLNCYSKIHLLRQIQKTNFMDIIDFELPPK